MKNIVTAAIILVACVLGAIALHSLKVSDQNAVNYIKWQTCIAESDGSDAECQACDAKYNPDNLPFDMADSSRLSDYK